MIHDERYTDPIDISARTTEKMLEDALKQHRENTKYKLPANGKCWYCGETVKKDLVFCKPTKQDVADNYSCRGAYEELLESRKRNGKL